ncbi:hypothetical protein ACSZMZ_08570 [Aeromonas veronii]
MLQFSLQSQTGIEGALQQGNPIFQATGGHDGAVVATKDNATTRVTAQIADRCCSLRIQSNHYGQRNDSLLVHRFHSDQTLAFSTDKTASAIVARICRFHSDQTLAFSANKTAIEMAACI